ncbi:MAG TPA: beta-propeller domain-containing protein [Rhizomicrobium sp.]|nr:beta-propeller domain-containing protein [Rhizomicrobium sp.]
MTLRFWAVLALGVSVSGTISAETQSAAPHKTLRAFKSDDEIRDFLKRHMPKRGRVGVLNAPMAMLAEPPAPPPPPSASADKVETVVSAGAPASADRITNNQEAGVDEGDIVKKRGDILVVLRRGRLFTISLAHGRMQPVGMINAYPPGVDARDDWYDEMLIHDDRIIVIGYSYGRGGVEINRFHLGGDGHLAFEDAYQLRANDYYSSRNYASRLIGSRLVFYSPLYVGYYGDPFERFPALRRWTGDANAKFARIVSARHVYVPAIVNDGPGDLAALHTVTNCDVTAPVLDCHATSVFGPASRSFYVSGNAVYVWTSGYDWQSRGPRSGMLYRLPLDGSAPSAIGVRGAPTDQFSFREDPGLLNVLVRADSAGDAMWNGEHSAGAIALLRLSSREFGDGSDEAAIGDYRSLPRPVASDSYDFHNRFAGDYVLYGVGNGWGAPRDSRSFLVAAGLRDGNVTELPLEHGVDRIELMGPDALVIGSDAHNVTFAAIELGRTPHLGDTVSLASASQAESRSHAFFYKPESRDGTAGVIGLPVAREGRPEYRQLFENSVAMEYLRWSDRRFRPLGELDASNHGFRDDACVASCVDWYGNARPIFLPDRTFALMGYELVEGALSPNAIRETDRISFAPLSIEKVDR